MPGPPLTAVVSGADWWRAPQTVRPSTLPFAALLAFTFILILAPQTFFPVLASIRIAFLTGLMAIGAHVVSQFVRGRPIVTGTREMSTAACLVLWAAATIPFSYWPGGSFSFLTNTYFKTLAVFWLLGNVVNTIPRLRAIAWGLTLMSAPLGLTGIKNFLSGSFVSVGQSSVNRIKGYDAPLALNPNDLALILNLMIPLGIALFLSTRRASTRVILGALVALAALAVIFTFSRAGFLTLAAMFGIYAWKLRHRAESPWVWAALVVALACVPFLPSGYSDRLTTIVDVDSDPTGSAQARWADTQAALRLVIQHPVVGAGIGQHVLALNAERGPTWKEVHNVYLEYAVELGLPGLGLFLLLVAQSLRSTIFAQRKAARDPARRELFFLAEGVQVSLLAFLVAAVFHPGGYQFGFYYFAGLAAATRVIAEACA